MVENWKEDSYPQTVFERFSKKRPNQSVIPLTFHSTEQPDRGLHHELAGLYSKFGIDKLILIAFYGWIKNHDGFLINDDLRKELGSAIAKVNNGNDQTGLSKIVNLFREKANEPGWSDFQLFFVNTFGFALAGDKNENE